MPILGTSPEAIHLAEDRSEFSAVLAAAGLLAPRHGTAMSVDDAAAIATEIGYPVLIRPSYVLGGRGMEIVYDEPTLHGYMRRATQASPEHPVLIDRFLDDAIELDVDALFDGEELYLGGVMEHIEEAGIHSGDSACALPPITLGREYTEAVRASTEAIARGVGVRGLLNVQYALAAGVLYVLEANPRASRTVPFVSKATAVPLAKAATRIMLGASIAQLRAEGVLAASGDSGTLPLDAVALHHHSAGRVGRRAGHRSRDPRRHRGAVVAGAAQRARRGRTVTGFGARLAEARLRRGPLCLGIDPQPELLTPWGLPTNADGLAAFCDICIEAFAGFAIVKPQVAFFEAYGAAGYAVLERTIGALREAGVLVLADAKRGDIRDDHGGLRRRLGRRLAAGRRRRDGRSVPGVRLATAAAGDRCCTSTGRVRGGRILQPGGRNRTAGPVRRARTVAQLIVDQAAVVNKSASQSERESGGARLRRRGGGGDDPQTARSVRPRRTGAGARPRGAGRAARGARRPGRGGAGPAAAGGVTRGAAGGPGGAGRNCGRRASGCARLSPISLDPAARATRATRDENP